MARHPNQKTIYIENVDGAKHVKDSGNSFVWTVDFKYEAAAMLRLNGNAFKLWRYLLRWYGEGKVDFSPTALKNEIGLGKNAPSDSLDELIRVGYITIDENGRYHFDPVLDADYQLLEKQIK